VVLARAPTRLAPAATVERDHLAVGRERAGDADPIVGVEIIGAVHDEDRRAALGAETPIKNRDVAGIDPPAMMRNVGQGHFRTLPLHFLCQFSSAAFRNLRRSADGTRNSMVLPSR